MNAAAAFLAKVTTALESSGVPYMLAGSFASSHHGAPRATQDIDIVVDPSSDSLDKFLNAMASPDVYFDAEIAREEFQRRGQFNLIDASTAWKVDVIFRKPRAFSKAEMKRRIAAKVLGVDVFVATAEDTILAKLEWARLGESERQIRDVRMLIETNAERLDRNYIERWLDDLGVRASWERVSTDAP